MATHGWRTGTRLIEDLGSCYRQYDFFQIVRLLRVYFDGKGKATGGAARIDDMVTFGADTEFDFSAAEVSALSLPGHAKEPAGIKLTSFTLSSGEGPLPEPHRELLFRRIQDGDLILNDFLDIFNDRLNKLRCGFKETNCTALTARDLSESRLSIQLRRVIGFSTAVFDGRCPFHDRSLMSFSGLLSGNRRGAAAIASILSTMLGAPVSVGQFTGKWGDMEPGDRTTIGLAGRNNTLGKNAVVGRKTWNVHRAITVRIGPIDFGKLEEILPEGGKYDGLYMMVRFLLKDECDCEISVGVNGDGIPFSRLAGADTADGKMSRLGGLVISRNAWIKTHRRDAGDRATVGFTIKTGEMNPNGGL